MSRVEEAVPLGNVCHGSRDACLRISGRACACAGTGVANTSGHTPGSPATVGLAKLRSKAANSFARSIGGTPCVVLPRMVWGQQACAGQYIYIYIM